MHAGHGGVVIGSEMSGGVKNVVVSNCIFKGTDRGIRLKTQRGRGASIENVSFSNIIMENIGEAAIVVDMIYYDKSANPWEMSEEIPAIRNVSIDQLTVLNAGSAFDIQGIEEMPVEDLRISNCSFQVENSGKISLVTKLKLKDVSLFPKVVAALSIDQCDDVQSIDMSNICKLSSSPVLHANNCTSLAVSNLTYHPNCLYPLLLQGKLSNVLLTDNTKQISLETSNRRVLLIDKNFKKKEKNEIRQVER
jgi:hypothetical protein